jgi:antitoxin VapB
MPYLIKNPEVETLLKRLADARKVTKVEALKGALRSELDREAARPSLVDRIAEKRRALLAKTDPASGKPADKAWIDSLYE